MNSNYSMDGFDLRVRDGIIELRAQGKRLPGTERAPASAFRTLASQIDSRLILYDLRDAHYVLSSFEWEERARLLARLFHGYRIAYVIRKDQVEASEQVCEAHRRLSDRATHCTSREAARKWLRK